MVLNLPALRGITASLPPVEEEEGFISDLVATANSHRSMLLTFTPWPDTVYYRYRVNGGAPAGNLPWDNVIHGFVPETEYDIEIQPMDIEDNPLTEWSNIATETTLQMVAPVLTLTSETGANPPTFLMQTGEGSFFEGGTPDIAWSVVLQRDTVNTFDSEDLAEEENEVTLEEEYATGADFEILETLFAGTHYYYRIREKDPDGNSSPWSNIVDDLIPAIEPYTLDDFQSDYIRWWDAEDAATLTKDGSNNVTVWNDKSASADVATADGSPLWGATSGPGGIPGITFGLAGSTDGTFALAQDYTAQHAIVALLKANADHGGSTGYPGISSSHNVTMFAALNGGSWGTYTNAASGSQVILQTGQTYLLVMAGGKFYTNGAEAVGWGYNPPSVGRAGNGNIGGYAPYGETSQITISKLLWLTDAVMTDEYRQIIEGIIAHEAGIQSELPSDHPYKTNPPGA